MGKSPATRESAKIMMVQISNFLVKAIVSPSPFLVQGDYAHTMASLFII
jgi:hypothetical protein